MIVSGQAARAAEAWDCGKIPGTVKAEFCGDTLTVRGEGRMKDYSIGAYVASIGRGAFMHCHDLASVICLGVVPPTIEENKYGIFDVFDTGNAVCLYVPKSCVGIYKTTVGWKDFSAVKSTDDYMPATGDHVRGH